MKVEKGFAGTPAPAGLAIIVLVRSVFANIWSDVRLRQPLGAGLLGLLSIGFAVPVAGDSSRARERLFYESIELHKQGRPIEAIQKLEQAQKLDPENPNVIANLAQFSAEAGMSAKAAGYFGKLVQLEPDNLQAQIGHGLYRAIVLAEAGKHKAAIAVLEPVINKAPGHKSLLWNIALFAAEDGQHGKARNYWLRLAALEPHDMHVQSKIIQSHQAVNDREGRDRAIEKIMQMYRDRVDPQYIEHNKFCREQYKVGDWKVLVFEYFEPGTKDQYFYRYSAVDAAGREQFWLSLGSYEMSSAVAPELSGAGAGARVYHLDFYNKTKHASYGMYDKKPAYDELRALTREIIVNQIAGHNSKNPRAQPGFQGAP